MKIEQLKPRQTIDKVNGWSAKVLEDAIYSKDTFLMVQSYVLLELSHSVAQEVYIPFEEILKRKTPKDFIKSSPSLFLEFLFLMKKYQPDLYTEELAQLIDEYESILEEIWDESPNNTDVFFILNMISRLKNSLLKSREPLSVSFSEDSFLMKSKSVIEKNLNNLLMASCYGQKKIELTTTTIEALETIMLDFAAKYDLILASKVLRILIYTGVTDSYITKLVYDFLLKSQSIEGYIGHYEAEFVKTKTENIAQSQQLQITKEMTLAILEYNSNYRYIRDFSF